MEILDQIEEARKGFVKKVCEILPQGYDESQVHISIDLHDRAFNADLVEKIDWAHDDAGGSVWADSSSDFCNKVTVFYDKEA